VEDKKESTHTGAACARGNTVYGGACGGGKSALARMCADDARARGETVLEVVRQHEPRT